MGLLNFPIHSSGVYKIPQFFTVQGPKVQFDPYDMVYDPIRAVSVINWASVQSDHYYILRTTTWDIPFILIPCQQVLISNTAYKIEDLYDKSKTGFGIPLEHKVNRDHNNMQNININIKFGSVSIPLNEAVLILIGKLLSNNIGSDFVNQFSAIVGKKVNEDDIRAAFPPQLLYKIPNLSKPQLRIIQVTWPDFFITDFHSAYTVWTIQKKLGLLCDIKSNDGDTVVVTLDTPYIISKIESIYKIEERILTVIPVNTHFSICGIKTKVELILPTAQEDTV